MVADEVFVNDVPLIFGADEDLNYFAFGGSTVRIVSDCNS